MKKFLVRLTNWEYWPFKLFYAPVFFYYIWLSLKRRSFFFFTASNPGMEGGGMFGEKKSDIFHLIPKEFIPKTVLIPKEEDSLVLEKAMEIGYPLIAKPNIGERGNWVKKIDNEPQMQQYAEHCNVDFLMQELVEYPIELGVFYVRRPDEEKGHVTSIVRKQFLTVKGDGKKTINQILHQSERALLTANLESDFLKQQGNRIPESGEEIVIEPIGNHCRGTQFLNDNHQISGKLNNAIDLLAKRIGGFYYGRFDLKCQSYEDLTQLKNFKILELNGAGAEAAHIYNPGYSLIKAYKDIFWHFNVLSDISAQNKKRGVSYWPFRKGVQKWKDYKDHYRKLEA